MDNKQKAKILDQAFDTIKSQQEKDLVIDFDAAVESQKRDSIKIKYGKEMYRSTFVYWAFYLLSFIGINVMHKCYRSKVFTVPGETPVWYMNIINRKVHELKSIKIDELSEEELIERFSIGDDHNEMVFRRLLGNEFVDEYMKDNFVNWKLLNEEILNPILKKWGWKPIKDTSEKKSLRAVS